MFARVAEFLVACWLAMSPWIFAHPASARGAWAVDLGCAAAVALLALLSYAPRLRRAHLLEIVPALVLIVRGYTAGDTAAQNEIVVGVLLLMLLVVPSRATEPPEAWLRWHHDRRDQPG